MDNSHQLRSNSRLGLGNAGTYLFPRKRAPQVSRLGPDRRAMRGATRLVPLMRRRTEPARSIVVTPSAARPVRGAPTRPAKPPTPVWRGGVFPSPSSVRVCVCDYFPHHHHCHFVSQYLRRCFPDHFRLSVPCPSLSAKLVSTSSSRTAARWLFWRRGRPDC